MCEEFWQAEFDGFANESFHFLERVPHGYASRQVRHVRAIVARPGLFHDTTECLRHL